MYIELRLYADNKPLTPVLRTAYRTFAKEWQYVPVSPRCLPAPELTSRPCTHSWGEHITFPWNLSELPLNAQVGFTIYDTAGPSKRSVVGGTTFRLFGKRG